MSLSIRFLAAALLATGLLRPARAQQVPAAPAPAPTGTTTTAPPAAPATVGAATTAAAADTGAEELKPGFFGYVGVC